MIKEREANSWKSVSYAKSISGAQTYTKFPIVLRTTEQSIPTWNVKGNMVQSGTPTPTTPIYPSECGERTENLLDYSTFVNDYWLNNNTGLPQPYNNGGRIATTSSIDVTNVNNVTFNFTSGVANTQFMYSLFNGSTLIERVTGLSRETTIDVSNGDTLYLCLYRTTGLPITISDVSNAMLNVGSTAKPYEPYGYKIPIVSGNTTTNIYLGSTQTVRNVYKYAFTGQENDWRITGTGRMACVLPTISLKSQTNPCICTHYIGVGTSSIGSINNGECSTNTTGNEFIAYDTDYTSLADFKTYLQQQYANGTPVTVWYVLATETTGIVNEPIRKIGDYVDTVSNPVSIPTTSGLNTINVATSLKPSEMSLTYDGYKLCKGQRYSRTENLFDKDNDVEKFYVRASDGTYKKSTGNSYSAIIPCVAGTAYTITTISKTLRVGFYATKPVDGTSCIESFNNNNSSYTSRSVTYTASTNATYMAIYAYQDGDEYSDGKTLDDIYGVLMVNTGSTAKPYQPYLVWE